MSNLPRMLLCLVLSLALMLAALCLQSVAPGTLAAVTAYKVHLMALGGWGGYWLDRALFPYDRPHQYLLPDVDPADETPDELVCGQLAVATNQFAFSMLRRAIIVAACLICVGLGA